jgi:hypothetical protein
LKPYGNRNANEHREQSACLERGFTGTREEQHIHDEHDSPYGNADIPVTDGLFHCVLFPNADNSFQR